MTARRPADTPGMEDLDLFMARAEATDERRLKDLHRWLTIGGSGGLFAGVGFLVLPGLVFWAAVIGAVLFGPYMLWQLYKCGRHGWITAFAVVVLIPAVLGLVVDGLVAQYAFFATALVAFYTFTWALRFAVANWLETAHWQRKMRLPVD